MSRASCRMELTLSLDLSITPSRNDITTGHNHHTSSHETRRSGFAIKNTIFFTLAFDSTSAFQLRPVAHKSEREHRDVALALHAIKKVINSKTL